MRFQRICFLEAASERVLEKAVRERYFEESERRCFWAAILEDLQLQGNQVFWLQGRH